MTPREALNWYENIAKWSRIGENYKWQDAYDALDSLIKTHEDQIPHTEK